MPARIILSIHSFSWSEILTDTTDKTACFFSFFSLFFFCFFAVFLVPVLVVAISILQRHRLYLFCCKHRAILADIDIAHIAATALAQAALHPVFEGSVD